jgi:uncharacterized DUF497 family protein
VGANKDEEKIIQFIKDYYNKFGLPRHGIELTKAKEIFLQFDKISQIFTRKGVGGKRYSVVYRLNKKKGYYLILLLDDTTIRSCRLLH